MRIPKFWARATHDGYEAPGWSFTSLADATRVAEERVRLLIAAISDNRAERGKYLYGDRPVREPMIEVVGEPSRPDAVVTRNAYGALCLNTEDVVFVDVDDTQPLLVRLAAAVRAKDLKDFALDRIRKAHARHADWALRIYRTSAGFRVVATHARMPPKSAEADKLMEELGADPLYRRLCAMQESFRARLTPKPWRIEMVKMPGVFPWRDDSVERRVNKWVTEYEAASPSYAVCELVETLGHQSLDPVIGRVLQFHDDRVLGAGKPLA